MSDIRLYVDHQRESGCPVPPYVTITDDHIRAIVERAREMGLIADNTPDPWADKPAAPADDEGTVKALADAIGKEIDWIDIRNLESTAEVVFAKIRRGEVPGLPSPDEHAALKVEVERLRQTERIGARALSDLGQQVERLEAERDAAVNKSVSLQGHLRNAEVESRNLLSERDAAIARAEKAEAENQNVRDALENLMGMHRCCYSTTEIVNIIRKASDQICSERDTDRAAHAEAMGLLARVSMKQGRVKIDGDSYVWYQKINNHHSKYGKDASK